MAKLAFPVALSVPVTVAPVPVTRRTLAVPATDMPTFPFAVLMFTFDVPLEILEPDPALIPVN